jgi:hypothetical protein
MESGTLVSPGQRALRGPDCGCDRPGSLLERRGTEEVRHDSTKWYFRAAGKEQRKLIDVFDQNVRPIFGDSLAYGPTAQQGEGVAVSHPLDLDTIELCPLWCPRPSGTDQPDAMSCGSESAENFEQVNFGTAGLRICPVLPIDEENVH